MPATSSLVLGLMSGTSADAIDVAMAQISGAPPNLHAKLLNHSSINFPPAVRKEILRVAEQQPISAAQLSQLNFHLGEIFGEAALTACKRFRLAPKKIALIGSHGQTIFHQGPPVPYLGRPTASTLQIGEPAVIAARTGITTIADFRPADIALGGQGAPLVPYADYLLYAHPQLGRVSLNLGGIANVTVLPAGCKPSQIFAFDTGPANMLIDALVQYFTHGRQRYDKNASFARRGQIHQRLIRHLMQDPYLKLSPPKSTGREYFGATYVKKLLAFGRSHKIKPADILYTVTYFTAASVVDALRRFVFPKHQIHQLIVSGGGARNPLLLVQLRLMLLISSLPALPTRARHSDRTVGARGIYPDCIGSASRGKLRSLPTRHSLKSSSAPIEVLPSSDLGIPTDAKEAFAFALLAYETFHHRPSNLPSATGAQRPAILGKISYAPPR
jgi:anhydro-N-acetylmuramic acid kinase